MSEYFPKLNALGRNVSVKLNLCKYVTKANLQNER